MTLPPGTVPKLPTCVVPVGLRLPMAIWASGKRLMARLRTVVPPPVIWRPTPLSSDPSVLNGAATLLPLISTCTLPSAFLAPPSIVVGPVTAGSGVAGLIVWVPNPGIAKVIVSAPAALFALVIAARRDPAPVSSVLVTVKVANRTRSSSASTAHRAAAPPRGATRGDLKRAPQRRSFPDGWAPCIIPSLKKGRKRPGGRGAPPARVSSPRHDTRRVG